MLHPGGMIVAGRRARGRGSAAKLQGALLFREEQGFGWPWPGMLLALIGAATFASVSAAFGLGMWTQLVLGRPWGEHPMSNGALLAAGSLAILGSLVPLGALFTRLEVEVRTDGIAIRFAYLGGGQILLRGEVDDARVVRLGFLDIGGQKKWHRRVYRLAGSEGIELRRTSGGSVVVSSERPQAFLAAVRAMLDSKHGR
jgi:hypothetical protein